MANKWAKNTWDYFNEPLSGTYWGREIKNEPYVNLVNANKWNKVGFYSYDWLKWFIAPQDTPNKNGVIYTPKLVAWDPYAYWNDNDNIYLLNLKTKEESTYPFWIYINGRGEVKNDKRMDAILQSANDNYLTRNDTPVVLNTLYDNEDYARVYPEWATYLGVAPQQKAIRRPQMATLKRAVRRFIK